MNTSFSGRVNSVAGGHQLGISKGNTDTASSPKLPYFSDPVSVIFPLIVTALPSQAYLVQIFVSREGAGIQKSAIITIVMRDIPPISR